MAETDEWIDHLRSVNRKESTLRTHRNNVKRCLLYLWADLRSTEAADITTDDIQYLWRTLPVKESVRMSYLRSLSGMVEFHTGVDIVRRTEILHNRESRDRVFIDDDDFRVAYAAADPLQRVVLCLGAYMGLRRIEMHAIRDCDIDRGILTVHGKGHGQEGLVAYMTVPEPVMNAIDEYRASPMKQGQRADDYLLQCLGKGGRLHRMHISRISDAVTDLGKSTGVRITTHSLRRYYATTLYYTTACDIQTVRRLMRHADVSTTLKCYVDAYDKVARDASNRLVEHISVIVGEGQDGCGRRRRPSPGETDLRCVDAHRHEDRVHDPGAVDDVAGVVRPLHDADPPVLDGRGDELRVVAPDAVPAAGDDCDRHVHPGQVLCRDVGLGQHHPHLGILAVRVAEPVQGHPQALQGLWPGVRAAGDQPGQDARVLGGEHEPDDRPVAEPADGGAVQLQLPDELRQVVHHVLVVVLVHWRALAVAAGVHEVQREHLPEILRRPVEDGVVLAVPVKQDQRGTAALHLVIERHAVGGDAHARVILAGDIKLWES